jgi:hypothetical protein
MSMWTKRPLNYCELCGYTWYPRGKNRSIECPNCRSNATRMVSYSSGRSGCSLPGMGGVITILCFGCFAMTTLGNIGRVPYTPNVTRSADPQFRYTMSNNPSPASESTSTPRPLSQQTLIKLEGRGNPETLPFTLERGNYTITWTDSDYLQGHTGCSTEALLARADLAETVVRMDSNGVRQSQANVSRVRDLQTGQYSLKGTSNCDWKVIIEYEP